MDITDDQLVFAGKRRFESCSGHEFFFHFRDVSKATGQLFTSLLLFVAQIIYILSLAIYKVKIKTFEFSVVRNFFGQHFHPLLFTAIAASYINTLDEFN